MNNTFFFTINIIFFVYNLLNSGYLSYLIRKAGACVDEATDMVEKYQSRSGAFLKFLEYLRGVVPVIPEEHQREFQNRIILLLNEYDGPIR